MDVTLLPDQPVLVGPRVRLEPIGEQHLEDLWPMFDDGLISAGDVPAPIRRLADFAREQVRAGLARAAGRDDRADWAIVRAADGQAIGEAVLFELDEDHDAMTFRIALVGADVFGQGFGTEATRLVRDFAFDRLGLHRLQLEVAADNEAAQAVYRRVGFVEEGRRREVRLADGRWQDEILMALLETDPRP